MILNVYAYYNKLLEGFANPVYDDHTPEQVSASITRELKAKVLQNQVENLTYVDFYILGQFDDEKGEFVNDKHLVLDLGNVIAGLRSAAGLGKEEKKDGNDN